MFSFISSVAVFASENIFTDGTELDISENKKTNLYNVDNTANENDFISEIEESEMSKTVLNEENIDPKELHAFNYNYINANYAQTECQFRYCGTAIPFLTVRSTAR